MSGNNFHGPFNLTERMPGLQKGGGGGGHWGTEWIYTTAKQPCEEMVNVNILEKSATFHSKEGVVN